MVRESGDYAGRSDLPHITARMTEEWGRWDGPTDGLCSDGKRTLCFVLDRNDPDALYPTDETGGDLPRTYLLHDHWNDKNFMPCGDPIGWCSERDLKGAADV